jgi:hypothetical protein
MLGLAIFDMQNWMFRFPERTAQIPPGLIPPTALSRSSEILHFPPWRLELHGIGRSG